MTRPRFLRYSLDDPARLAHLIRNGAIWRLPMFWPKAIEAIERGLVPLDECPNVPDEVARVLRRR